MKTRINSKQAHTRNASVDLTLARPIKVYNITTTEAFLVKTK